MAVADRAYKFAQIVWGRAFLAGLGARLSPDYLGFNSAGEVIEAGRLEEEAYFAAASRNKSSCRQRFAPQVRTRALGRNRGGAFGARAHFIAFSRRADWWCAAGGRCPRN